MQILSDINIDLQRPASMKTIYATQGDSGTRGVRIKLFNGGVEWPVPPEVADIFISYCKPDGHGGTYNTIPEGTNPAWQTSLNTITISLAPQVLTCAGLTKVDVKMCNEAGDSLRTFTFSVMVIESAENGIQSTDYWKNPTLKGIQDQIGDTSELLTNAKENLVSAVNEVNKKATGLSKGIVKSVNGTQPDETGDVKVLADDLDVEIQEFQYHGSIVGAVKTLYGLSVLNVNGKTPNKDGVLALTSDSIPMDDGDYQWGHINVTQAIEQIFGKIPSDSKINSLILALLKSYAKTVNGVAPGEDGNVLLESDNIQMSDGGYGWAGYNVTQAIDEVMASIPTTQKINSLIDAKLAQLPFAEGVTFNG